MTNELLNKAEESFKKELKRLERGDFKYLFPFTHKGKTYNGIYDCLDVNYSGNYDDKEPMMTYHDDVGVNIPYELRVVLEDTFCGLFPNGLFNGHACD